MTMMLLGSLPRKQKKVGKNGKCTTVVPQTHSLTSNSNKKAKKFLLCNARSPALTRNFINCKKMLQILNIIYSVLWVFWWILIIISNDYVTWRMSERFSRNRSVCHLSTPQNENWWRFSNFNSRISSHISRLQNNDGKKHTKKAALTLLNSYRSLDIITWYHKSTMDGTLDFLCWETPLMD